NGALRSEVCVDRGNDNWDASVEKRQSKARCAFEDKGGDREVLLDGGCNKTVPSCQDAPEHGSVGTDISPDKNKHSSIGQTSQRATTNQPIETAATIGGIEVRGASTNTYKVNLFIFFRGMYTGFSEKIN
ncbi:hypothetical protein PanWU01x14_020180, partial [Parasponia andersonii]